MRFLTKKEVISLSDERISIVDCLKPGIYFLLTGDVVVYIGQSANAMSRIASHSDKDFNKVSFIPTDKELLNDAEAYYIVLFSPELNRSIPSNSIYSSVGRLRRLSIVITNEFIDEVGDNLSILSTDKYSYLKNEDADTILRVLREKTDSALSELIALGE